jgi:hypothetical protein
MKRSGEKGVGIANQYNPIICQKALAHHDYGCKVMQNDNDRLLQFTVFHPDRPYTFQETMDTSFCKWFSCGGKFLTPEYYFV